LAQEFYTSGINKSGLVDSYLLNSYLTNSSTLTFYSQQLKLLLMKKFLLNLCLALGALVITTNFSWAQGQGELTGIQYRNIKVADNGESFSMEIWAYSVEPAYTNAALPWDTFTIRIELAFDENATADGIDWVKPYSITYGLATEGNLAEPPGGSGVRLGINLSRGETGGELTVEPKRLATIVVPIAGGTITSATIASTRPSPPNPGSTETFWLSTVDEGIRRSLIIPSPTALPVTLTSFKVSKEGTSVAHLNWTTTQESNSSHFEIERRANAGDWQVLGSKQSASNSDQLLNYNFTDVAPMSGINYYRLKMVDLDGTFSHSRIESASFGELTDRALTVFPNPVSDVLYLNDADVNALKEVALVSTDGIVAYQSNTVTTDGISVKNLSDGLYIVKVTRADGSLTNHRVLITR
jgi:hypothetical protein